MKTGTGSRENEQPKIFLKNRKFLQKKARNQETENANFQIFREKLENSTEKWRELAKFDEMNIGGDFIEWAKFIEFPEKVLKIN